MLITLENYADNLNGLSALIFTSHQNIQKSEPVAATFSLRFD